MGRRIGKTVNGVTTTYQYDGLDAIREVGPGGEATTLRTLAIDEALTRTEGATTTTSLADTLGSTLALADAAGAPTTTYTYAPFGETRTSGALSPNPFRFTGREEDGTGLYYYRARYYDPARSRFVSEDPIGWAGGLNLYRYSLNSPLEFLDPLGLDVTITLYRGAVIFGHIGVGVNAAGPLDTWGHYPREKVIYGVGGEVLRDAMYKSREDIIESITIRTTEAQDRAMQRVIMRSVGNRWYRLTGRNCATFVGEVLRAGTVEVPDTIYPRVLLNELKQIHGVGYRSLFEGITTIPRSD